jgi:glycosyltransferase involved in cell wall biosynthesis
MTPAVTVLMSTYNRSRFLPEALDSVLGQTVPPAQVVVVDDGSTDNTTAVLRSYLERIEHLRQENGGKAAALNRALPRVRGEYVWVFDDDDVARPQALASHLARFRPDVDFVYGGYDRARTGADGRLEIAGTIPCPDVAPDRLFITLLDRCLLLQQGMLVRTSCYRELGGYNERLIRSQDYDMILRLAHRFRGAPNPEITFVQRLHEGQRGSATRKVVFAQRTDAWADYDKIIGEYWFERLDLREYLGRSPGGGPLTPVDVRAARIMRASIAARKGMWGKAVAELVAVVEDGTREALSTDERGALARMTRIHYWKSFKPLLADRSIARRLRRALGGSALGRSIRAELFVGLVDQLREGMADRDVKLVAWLLELCARLLGPSGVIDLVLSRDRLAGKGGRRAGGGGDR